MFNRFTAPLSISPSDVEVSLEPSSLILEFVTEDESACRDAGNPLRWIEGATSGSTKTLMSDLKDHSASRKPGFWPTPFAALSSAGLPSVPGGRPEEAAGQPATAAMALRKNRGRVDIVRQTAHRGGKTVTVVKNFVGIGLPEKEQLARQMRKVCGTGGTVKDGQIEIHGDKRNEVTRILTEAGFRPVFAGG
jgi:translation initiation factor 1